MNPFAALIDVTALNGLDGFVIEGINPNFGNGVGSGGAVSPAGDINGDGIGDLVIGAERGVSRDPVTNAQRFTAGEVYVVFGSAAGFGASLSPFNLNGTNGFRIQGGREALGLGFDVSSAGDINNDGFDDLLLGSRATSLGQSAEPGEAFVIFGKGTAYNAVQDIYTFALGEAFQVTDPNPSIPGQLGRSVSNIGDFNGDGFDDFAIGEAKAFNPFDPSNQEQGAVHVILGGPTTGFPLSGTPGAFPRTITYYGPLQDGGLGTDISGIGDFNGDGLDDFIALAPGAPFRTPAEIFGIVIFGDNTVPASGNFAQDLRFLPTDASAGFQIRQLADPAGSVANAGDVNGDGLDDIIIGGPNALSTRGLAYVIYGTASPTFNLFPATQLDGTNGFQITGELAGDFFGSDVHAAGDVNGDGYDDVIIGAQGANRTGGSLATNTAGAAYVVFGGPGTRPAVLDASTLDGTNGFQLEGVSPFSPTADDALGTAVSGGVDINGDGIDDVLIGAPDATAAPGGVSDVRSGRTYVVYGKDTGVLPLLNGTPQIDTLTGANGNDRINGLEANDILNGGLGDDIIEGGPGADSMDGQGGIDTLSYENATTGVLVDLLNGTAVGGDAQGDTFAGFENLAGGSAADQLSGTNGANTIRGGDGNDILQGFGGPDVLDGGAGFNFVRYSEITTPLTIDLMTPVNSSAAFADDTLIDIKGIFGSTSAANTFVGDDARTFFTGGSQGDSLVGNGGGDILRGQGGGDTIDGGDGRDALIGNAGDDTMTGGADEDVFYFNGLTNGDDVITDFMTGMDLLGFDDPTINSAADLGFGTSTGGWLEVSYGTTTIELEGLALADQGAVGLFFY